MSACPSIDKPQSPRETLHTIVESLGFDEARVLIRIALRLQHGARLYGAFDLARDKRNFAEEGREEVEDFLVYAACRWLKEGR